MRFSIPTAHAGHVAPSCRAMPLAPAVPLRRSPWSPCLLRPDAPTGWAASCTHALAACRGSSMRFFAWRSLAGPTLRGSTPRVLIGTLRHFYDASLHRPRRPRCAGHAPATFCARRSATRDTASVTWSGPFSASKLIGVPSRERGPQQGGPCVTRVTVSLSTPFTRRHSWVSDSLRRFDPASGRTRVSACSDPRAVC
jgi:hypothetical protein